MPTLLPQQTTVNQFIADGVTTIYNFSFLIFLDTDINVYVTQPNVAPNPLADLQTLNVNYTVQNAGTIAGGTITFLAGSIPINGAIITLVQNIQATYNMDFSQAQTLSGANLNLAFQRLTAICANIQTLYGSIGQQPRVIPPPPPNFGYPFTGTALQYAIDQNLTPPNPPSNIVPALPNGFVWSGLNGQIVAVPNGGGGGGGGGANFPINTNIIAMTGLTGVLEAPTAIASSAGLAVLGFSYIANSVNHIQIQNNATGAPPVIAATGSDATVQMLLQSKGGVFTLHDETSTNGARLLLVNAANSNYIGLNVAAGLATTVNFFLPPTDGLSLAPLVTDGAGNLSFLPAPWVDWSSTIGFTGFSANPTAVTARYKKIGNTCFINIEMTAGTSNATTFTITGFPFASALTQFVNLPFCQDNSINLSTPVIGSFTGTTTTMACARLPTGAWTASGTKSIQGNFFYETA